MSSLRSQLVAVALVGVTTLSAPASAEPPKAVPGGWSSDFGYQSLDVPVAPPGLSTPPTGFGGGLRSVSRSSPSVSRLGAGFGVTAARQPRVMNPYAFPGAVGGGLTVNTVDSLVETIFVTVPGAAR